VAGMNIASSVIPHIKQKPVVGVSMSSSHTSGGHSTELEISPCDGWDTLWRGSHHMIMDGTAFSSTTHAVIPLVGVVTLNCLLKGFRKGAPSLFFNWPWLALPYLVEELEISREPPTQVNVQVGVPGEIPLALALLAIPLPPGSAE
jgi:hypothetical protein